MKKFIPVLLAICLLLALFAACKGKGPLDPKNPVTLSMWHDFDGGTRQTMDLLIDEFNATVGREQGVVVNVEAITSGASLQETMDMILLGDSGAPKMPDISTAYPKTAARFEAKGLLANLDAHFTGEELSGYVPAFVEEGRFGDGGLYVFPFANSTELLFVNKTFFDRFAEATGVTMDCFKTFEGIADAAMKYYEWTNEMTPDIPRDHRQFFTADSWFNLAQAGMFQQGAKLFNGETLALDAPEYRRVWETFYAPSVSGGVVLYDGYSSDLSKTGDIICSVGSSAGILFYENSVTSPDNTVEPVEYRVLPYPVFEGGKKFAIQRGSGFMVAKSDAARETAAALFLKWFTAPEQNMRFAAETGYLPVTKEAFETQMPQRILAAENPFIRQTLETVTNMYAEYDFFTAPVFEGFDALSKEYERRYRETMLQNREAYVNGGGLHAEDALAAFRAELGR